jgi:hypothetical protein
MNHYVIDKNNQIIPIPQYVVSKSSILCVFFKKNTIQGFQLNYSKKVIDQMIESIDNMISKNDTPFNELCQELNIANNDQKLIINQSIKNDSIINHSIINHSIINHSIINHSINHHEDPLNHRFDMELYHMGHATHIFNSIYFRGNESTHTRYIESRQPAQFKYLITVPKKRGIISILKNNIRSFFTNILYIDDDYNFMISSTEFKESYSILSDNRCIKNGCIHAIINDGTICNKKKYKQLINISWKYQAISSIPEMQIVVDEYNIGALINGNALGIQLNGEIFDSVITLIIKQMNKSNKEKSNRNKSQQKYLYQIIEIHKDYYAYIVRIKKIYVNYDPM